MATQSAPIALSVLEAQVIAAHDVVGTAEETPPSQAPAVPEMGAMGRIPPTPTADLTGADLTLNTELNRLTAVATPWLGGPAPEAALYGVSLVAVAVAWWRRKSNDVDPKIIAQRRLIKQQRNQLRLAASLPRQEAARQIAAACRQLAPLLGDGKRADADAVISECDALAFAPDASTATGVDEKLLQRALALTQHISEQR